MANVLILIASISKKLSRQLRGYPFFKISKNTYIFPTSARKGIGEIVSNSKFLLESEFAESALDERNNRLISKCHYPINLDGSKYRANFNEELIQLEKWFAHGVHAGQLTEYKMRLKALMLSFEKLKKCAFDTGQMARIAKEIAALEGPDEAAAPFGNTQANLRRISRSKDITFVERTMLILQKPTSLDMLSSKLGLAPDYVRERLNKLIKTGKVKKTEKLGKVGRPPYVYYLSQSILNY